MISMVDMVEMKGCILNLAVKKPAMVLKMVHSTTHTTRARMTRAGTGIPVKSKICPNTPPVLMPLCITMVAAVMPMPIIRPMDRSVPASIIRPATPRARNIRGEACWRMFRMLFGVSKSTFLTVGARMHMAMKTTAIARYRPLRSRKFRILKLYR